MTAMRHIVGIVITSALCAGSAAAALPAATPFGKLDSRLAASLAAAPADTVTAWVTFADKGERDAADLTARLRHAAEALSARARARRLRAGVSPLVDVLDLPVAPRYLADLEARGFAPFAVSRWFNRAAVRAPAARLLEVAERPFVATLTPVERARRSPRFAAARDADGGFAAGRSPAGPPRTMSAAHVLDYGRSLAQLEQMSVPAVHDSGYIGTGVLVCILDSGFRSLDRHEATRTIDVPPGMRRDFAEGDTVVSDGASAPHGLWTVSCMAANREGALVGSAPGASYALARTEVENSETIVEMLYWAAGAEWADSLGADVLSSSLGYNEFPQSGFAYGYADMDGHTTTVTRAAEIAASKGILVVNSVGNEGSSDWHYLLAPADVHGDSLIAVGAVTLDERLAYFSSAGPTADGRIKPDLVACGVANPLPQDDDTTGTGYIENSGTSLSAPLVAGLAACLLQARPTWTARDVIQALRETANRYRRPNNGYGFGVPNALAALRGEPGAYDRSLAVEGLLGLAVDAPNPLPHNGFPIRIRLALAASAPAPMPGWLRVVDVAGRTVGQLWSGMLTPGETREVAWDGAGVRARAGVHWIVLSAGGSRSAVRVVSL